VQPLISVITLGVGTLGVGTLGVGDLGRSGSFYEVMGWGSGEQPDEAVFLFQASGTVLWRLGRRVRPARRPTLGTGPQPVGGRKNWRWAGS
jgi:hypothetical protein